MEQEKIDKIIEFVKNDTRSKDEIFESLKQKIHAKYNNQLTEVEAIEATRRFIGVFQVFSDMYDDKKRRDS